MFDHLQPAPPDAILGLTEAFKADPNPDKVNLGVGVFKDPEGRTPVLQAVKAAEARLVESETTKSYLPITGSPDYGRHVQELLFGAGHDLVASGRVKTLHSPGGTGALRVGADFLSTHFNAASVWVSTPTWANHKGVFTAGGCAIREYPYYRPDTHGLDFTNMVDALRKIPAGDVVLLHVCCHNPTGVDPSIDQWDVIAEAAAEAGWIPFFDFAYQGFGEGLREDAAALTPFIEDDLEFFVASSFSKNFGLYNERTGALTMVAKSAVDADTSLSNLKVNVRTNYSNPSAHGGLIVTTILDDEELTAQWTAELAGMRDRIRDMRSALVGGLKARGVDQDFSFIEAQRGMFSFSGLNDEQVQRLRDEKSIYIVGGGRINVAGITPGNIDYLCDALAAVL